MAMTPCAAVTFPARPVVIRPRVAGTRGSARARSSGKWWAPLLGWSGRADYLEAPAPVPARDDAAEARKQFVGGLLTEEKARELRARMAETDCFHDAMYHSTIASRLARSTAPAS
ncbi:hypothetical protein QOZ80_5AG0403020 [Eleusine coracana subsp. coracana]|nr:hypothetical protein QOZ80_5AG0403020 [Eleusine coracana subsp. coracana]